MPQSGISLGPWLTKLREVKAEPVCSTGGYYQCICAANVCQAPVCAGHCTLINNDSSEKVTQTNQLTLPRQGVELEAKDPMISSLGTQACRVLSFSEHHPRFLSYPSHNQGSPFKEDHLGGFETTEVYVAISMGSLSYLSLMGLGLSTPVVSFFSSIPFLSSSVNWWHR